MIFNTKERIYCYKTNDIDNSVPFYHYTIATKLLWHSTTSSDIKKLLNDKREEPKPEQPLIGNVLGYEFNNNRQKKMFRMIQSSTFMSL